MYPTGQSRDGPEPQQLEMIFGCELRHVGQHDPDPIADLEFTGAQQRRQTGGQVVQPGVGEHDVVESNRRSVGVRHGRCK
jgi:hypothetical protein